MNHLTAFLRRCAQRTFLRQRICYSAAPLAEDDLRALRLRGWPELPETLRTAPVYRVLSVMTVRPVTPRWMQWQTGMDADQLGALLRELESQRVLKVERAAPGFGPRPQHAEPLLTV